MGESADFWINPKGLVKHGGPRCAILQKPAWAQWALLAIGMAGPDAQPYAGMPVVPGPTAPPNPAEALSAPVHTVFSSKIGFLDLLSKLGASYPRVIQLKQYAAGRGQLLATFGRRGALPVYRSTDNGESWQFLSEIPNLNGQPALYELPRKMGNFPAGTVMAAGIGASAPGSKTLRLDLSVSSDRGKSWKALSTISEGGLGRYDPVNRAALSIQSPVWEPYLYADARGELVAYISNEGHKAEGYSQLLEHKVSRDGGKSWGPAVYDVAIGDGLTRPGMAVVTQGAERQVLHEL